MRQRDFPREIVIGENVWDVRFSRQIPGETIDTLGMCDPSVLTIYIRTGQTPEERFKTFLHESLHAIEYEFGLKIPHALIHKLEEPIVRMFIDNGVIL